jgi:hypothetical protein
MIALLLGQFNDTTPAEITGLLERVQRPAMIRLRRCRISWGSVSHLTFDGDWHGLIDCCVFGVVGDRAPLVLEAWPGIEIDWADRSFTVMDLAAEVERQRVVLGAGR